jgi:O-antigen ligase
MTASVPPRTQNASPLPRRSDFETRILAPGVLLALPIAGAAIGPTRVLPGVTVADLCIALFLALFVLRAARRRGGLPGPQAWPPFAPWLAAFALWAIGSGLVSAALDTPGFLLLELVKSAAKLVLYAPAATAFVVLARAQPFARTARSVQTWFAFAAALAIALYAAMLALPQARAWVCGDVTDYCRAYYYEHRWQGHDVGARALVEGVHLRAIGLASEPAKLGLALSLALAYLVLGGPAMSTRTWLTALIALAALLTFSLATYAILAATLVGAMMGRRHRRRVVVALAVLVLATLALPSARRALHDAVWVRAEHIVSGAPDLSTQLRVESSWDVALALAARRPLVGVGLGQYERHVPLIADEVARDELFWPTMQGWNVFAYVLATTGLGGLVLFGIATWRALRPAPALAFVFVVGAFADGGVLAPPFWVSFALFASVADARRRCQNGDQPESPDTDPGDPT